MKEGGNEKRTRNLGGERSIGYVLDLGSEKGSLLVKKGKRGTMLSAEIAARQSEKATKSATTRMVTISTDC